MPQLSKEKTIDAEVTPEGGLNLLSQAEVNQLLDSSRGGLYDLYRRCSLAVLNSGSHIDDSKIIMEQYKSFDIRIKQQERGVKLVLKNAPESAFVDGEMIQGIKEHLFAVLRDVIYTNNEIIASQRFDLMHSVDITNAIFHILRNAEILRSQSPIDLVVCWGGHSISKKEYEYTKEVGHELGLRGLNICTGCGPGAMMGPMEGSAIGHAKQRIQNGRFIGITEPGIIAAESPNPIVNELAIMPDIEKRLESFVRVGHAVIVFPGGAGTMEEVLYLLGVLLHHENAHLPFPLVFTGPENCVGYFNQIDEFISTTLGEQARKRYRVIMDNPAEVAREVQTGLETVCEFRITNSDAYHFNWLLKIEQEQQIPLTPSHETMAGLELHHDQQPYLLAAQLRRAFSGIVSGNVKEEGIRAIEQYGPFEIKGSPGIIQSLDKLLSSFSASHRMKLPGKKYEPCYRVIV